VFLLFVSFVAGVLTAIAPCVLPLLPVIVGGSLSGGTLKGKALTISASLGFSVIVFTLLLKASTAFIAIPQTFWQWFSAAIVIAFGLTMVFPVLWDRLGFVNAMNREGNKLLASGYQQNSLWGDVVMGAALGPVFSSCSPTYFVILATVLPASFAAGLLDLFAYALGLSGFLFLIALVGQRLVDKLGIAINPSGWFRRGIGVLFVVVGIAVGTGAQNSTQTWLLNHGFDLSFVEEHLLGAGGASSGPQIAADLFLTPEQKAGTLPKAPELASIDGYINTSGQPVTIGQFKGNKVVLIDFWTYSCINCQREIPYVEMWQKKYADQGLEIIGVSTPEFAFEHVLGNVQSAVQRFGITYPVVLDNEYATWNAFGNQFWPRVYLIDIDGYVVYDHAGEGDYDKTELAIQRALRERQVRLGIATSTFAAPGAPSGAVEVDQAQLGSPETYFGSNRNEFLGNGSPGTSGVSFFEEPQSVAPNTLYLIGKWDIEPEFAQTTPDVGSAAIGSDRVDYMYHAQHLYWVAGAAGGSVDAEVTLDGKPLDPSIAGKDVFFRNGRSYVSISQNRLYELVSDKMYQTHLLELIIAKPGLQAYTFTFG
jgi:cytochrome c biogenesis protein CcdA/thiol-disulfide isomerase/thioredoxin